MPRLILSLDGGGVRGALTAQLIQKLEEKRPFLNKVELFAGTSTGGLIALALASGNVTPGQLTSFYVEHGSEIFRARDSIDRLAGPLDEMVRANYSQQGLRSAIETILGRGKTLGDLSGKVLISTFALDNRAQPPEVRHWKPKFLHNFESEGHDRGVDAVDAALQTSAAPTFFPSHKGSVDGGVVANNPATCALAQMISEGHDLEEIQILSIGTGFNPRYLEGGDWGYKQWLLNLIPMWLDGLTGIADYQCRQLLKGRYHRLDVTLPEVIDIDDVSKIKTLVALARDEDLIEETLAWIDANVR